MVIHMYILLHVVRAVSGTMDRRAKYDAYNARPGPARLVRMRGRTRYQRRRRLLRRSRLMAKIE